ncbi:MAG: TIGR02996 domain-containing protein [Planctomycetia bacterium]|nr:TIGR02996 domain-containing protein [Planctomycetia bacterium]
MNEEQAFLAAISANPADATTRLVFADWLTDRDDPRGEWLRVRTQLALGIARGAELTRLIEREQELAPDALASWFATDAPVWCLLGGGLPNPPIPDWLIEANLESWRWMIRFYDNYSGKSWNYLRGLQQFIVMLTGTEVAKLFRAGQSMLTFVVSTAEQHGLGQYDASVLLFASAGSPRFTTIYESPNRGKRTSAACDDETALRVHFGRFLARLWCDTRGSSSADE